MTANEQAVGGGEGGTVSAEGRFFTGRLYRARKGCRVTLSTSPRPGPSGARSGDSATASFCSAIRS
jgi:hypothetical protein